MNHSSLSLTPTTNFFEISISLSCSAHAKRKQSSIIEIHSSFHSYSTNDFIFFLLRSAPVDSKIDFLWLVFNFEHFVSAVYFFFFLDLQMCCMNFNRNFLNLFFQDSSLSIWWLVPSTKPNFDQQVLRTIWRTSWKLFGFLPSFCHHVSSPHRPIRKKIWKALCLWKNLKTG